MVSCSSAIIIVIIVAVIAYLIYSQNNEKISFNNFKQIGSKNNSESNNASVSGHTSTCTKCDVNEKKMNDLIESLKQSHVNPETKIFIDNASDPYSDAIKKQDAYSMNDVLTYPQMRLSREVLEKYNEYFDKHGSYPAFGQSTQPLFDNPVLNGYLVRYQDESDPFAQSSTIPNTMPLFRVPSAKHKNRFYYYTVEQRYPNQLQLKITLDNIRVNGKRYDVSGYDGLPELSDGDIISDILPYPGAKFIVKLYKIYHFP